MPRYFITTASETLIVWDEEGVELPDVHALRAMACRALAQMLMDKTAATEARSYAAWATDAAGELVLDATVNLTISQQRRA